MAVQSREVEYMWIAVQFFASLLRNLGKEGHLQELFRHTGLGLAAPIRQGLRERAEGSEALLASLVALGCDWLMVRTGMFGRVNTKARAQFSQT